MLSNTKLKKRLANRPAPRVTEEQMRTRITSCIYTHPVKTVTQCHLVLDNGFSVSGESSCVNAENYDEDVGRRLAHDAAFKKLWPLFGFLLAEKQFKKAKKRERKMQYKADRNIGFTFRGRRFRKALQIQEVISNQFCKGLFLKGEKTALLRDENIPGHEPEEGDYYLLAYEGPDIVVPYAEFENERN